MGCFLGCFGGSVDDRKRQKQRNKIAPRDHKHGSQKPFHTTASSDQCITEKPTSPVSVLRDNSEEQLSSSTRKRVTFDSNVTTYEHVSLYESVDSLPEKDKVSEKEKVEILAKSSHSISGSEDDSVTSSVGSHPPNHRYQNCRDSDDEAEEYGDSDLDAEYDEEDEEEPEDYYGDYEVKELWSETIPTSSMESRTESPESRTIMEEVESPVIICGLIGKEMNIIGSNRNARDRSVYVHPVLNPVENLTQWKAAKSKGTPPPPSLKPQKENFTAEKEAAQPRLSFTSEPSFKQSPFSFNSKCDQPKNLNQEIAVDASLSNWLASSETTPTRNLNFTGNETFTSEKNMSQGSNSVRGLEDRPILGALTVEELKQFSSSPMKSSSPRRSPSPDEMPIIGTVGTYWNHKGQVQDCGSASSYKSLPTNRCRELYLK